VQLLLKTMNVEKYHAYDKFILTVDWRPVNSGLSSVDSEQAPF